MRTVHRNVMYLMKPNDIRIAKHARGRRSASEVGWLLAGIVQLACIIIVVWCTVMHSSAASSSSISLSLSLL